MNILITGGAGYLGFELAKVLIRDPQVHSITIYDNFLRANYHPLQQLLVEENVTVIRGDILDGDKLAKALRDIDVVFHGAAVVGVPFNNEFSPLFEQTNHWGTAELCSLLEASAVSKLIYLSSGAVYGFSSDSFSVKDVPLPMTSYGHSKLNGEQQLQRLLHKMEVVILRMGNVFGYSPAMHFEGLINKYQLGMAFKEPLLVHGSGNQIRPYLHLSRAIKAFQYFLSTQYTQGSATYNIVDFNISINDILNTYQALDTDFEVIYVNQNQKLSDLSLEGNDLLNRLIGSAENFATYLKH